MYADEEHAACVRGVAGAVAARRLTMRERCRWWTCLRVVTSDALRRDNQLCSASKVPNNPTEGCPGVGPHLRVRPPQRSEQPEGLP